MKLLFRKTALGRQFSRAKRKLHNIRKYSIAHFPFKSLGEKNILFIVGCQRSGTTLLGRIFERDLNTSVLYEDNCLTGINGYRLRLKPVDEIVPVMAKMKFPLVVVKPLVESQRTSELLKNIPNMKSVWVYRNYKDVVNSKLNKFRRQLENLRCIAEEEVGNWRYDRVSSKTLDIAKYYYQEDMSKEDAAALMWYARNILFFEQNLQDNEKNILMKYEELIANPSKEMKRLYSFLELPYPGDKIVSQVDQKSLGLGKEVIIHPEIEELCCGLMNRFKQIH